MMTIREAEDRLVDNIEHWRESRKEMDNTEIALEIDKDFEAIEILLHTARLDYENMTYEELCAITKVIMPLKRQKYSKSETAKQCRKRYESGEKRKEYDKKYYKKNKDKIAKKYNDNKEQIIKKQIEYYNKNKEKCNEISKKSYNKNKDKINARRRELYRKKKENEKIITLFA